MRREEERTMPKTGKQVRELSSLMEEGRLAGVKQKLSEGRLRMILVMRRRIHSS